MPLTEKQSLIKSTDNQFEPLKTYNFFVCDVTGG